MTSPAAAPNGGAPLAPPTPPHPGPTPTGETIPPRRGGDGRGHASREDTRAAAGRAGPAVSSGAGAGAGAGPRVPVRGRLLRALGRRCRLLRCRRLSESGRLPAPRFYTAAAAATPPRPRTSPYMEIFQKRALPLAASRPATWGGRGACPRPAAPRNLHGERCVRGGGVGGALRRRPPAPVGPRRRQHRGTTTTTPATRNLPPPGTGRPRTGKHR